MTALPIDDALPDLLVALQAHGQAVLQAPPGAGKTTRVPLAILQAGLVKSTILMLEPRRLAARGAAERMAQTLGEPVGQTVGYRMRGASKVGPHTRIEVITEGILTRRLQSDPELTGVSAVIFDEFHERALTADLGLALCLEVREALRDDLILLIMSATLEADPVANLMGAPVITSKGRSYPVDIRWLNKPRRKEDRLDDAVARLVRTALSETTGSLLVFLPGEGEIRRTQSKLAHDLPAKVSLHPLYGALPFAEQQAAIAPAQAGRKVVLSTAIAETSLTIEGITCVVDGGLARRTRFDPGSGMSRLVTEKVTRAEATQRAGRAGRLAPGTCYRLWTKGEDGALAQFPDPEILMTDLTPLALECAAWGTTDLPFLTPPAGPALAEAQELLHGLGALDNAGRITDHGRQLARLPLHPRLAHMLVRAGPDAAPLAALLADRDPLHGAPSDLSLRLDAVRDPADFRQRHPFEVNRQGVDRIRSETKRLAKVASGGEDLSVAQMAALAYPDRIGLHRPGDAPRWLLSGGKGAVMAPEDPSAATRLIVALDLDGTAREARIRLQTQISEAELRSLYADRIGWSEIAEWSRRDKRVTARRQERFGAVILADQLWRDVPADHLADAALDGIRDLGLPWSKPSRRLQARAALYARLGGTIVDLSDEALLDNADQWLLPFLGTVRTAEDIKALDLADALRTHIGWDVLQKLDTQMPARFKTPMGRDIPIDYATDPPEIAVRLQEMFGQMQHPVIGPNRTPLRVTLLSPAQRPVQTTTDLPAFWTSSYADVRKDMRGRYPRHPWPEDPTQADPTLRAKPRS
ncbi:ATP-dependent helicase HrpB [Actibacterium sp. 188UL27-1]|uniref:ATP-dependent helicase HrpB n=1 Tax=Actibacterium sp. 188UL27-1 TaxID=2786961 RepID=UPI00195A5082|nr:ATP-dependent helicase HrpB [Actibacterium sp. 188UL27-1]MBM7066419.1 ATP-dependent helicase HrpB [Actibacterium sp. 188UL27-1]